MGRPLKGANSAYEKPKLRLAISVMVASQKPRMFSVCANTVWAQVVDLANRTQLQSIGLYGASAYEALSPRTTT